jgi:hypothetical protein
MRSEYGPDGALIYVITDNLSAHKVSTRTLAHTVRLAAKIARDGASG